MDREKLNRYKKNKRELAMIERQLERLQERLESVETVSGKVTKSGDDFPYIEEHITVQMAEPKAASGIKDRIRAREARIKVLKSEIEEVEDFISGLPEGIEKSVLGLVFLENMSQNDVAETVGYTQARVSQIIRDVAKDL
jgi:DNA-directed RNA polymerase specialized sigma subunit